MEKKRVQVDEQAEARINGMYALDIATARGDREILEEIKRDHPDIYAEWEKIQKERNPE